YVKQLDMLSSAPRTPLEPPRFRAFYRYRFRAPTCTGHRQGGLDSVLLSLLRWLDGLSEEKTTDEIRKKILTMMRAPNRDVAFFVGNQAKRPHVFSVLGVYYPSR